mgnify:CR=1 FL=1
MKLLRLLVPCLVGAAAVVGVGIVINRFLSNRRYGKAAFPNPEVLAPNRPGVPLGI